MPYKIRKQKCRQSTGKTGKYVVSYKDVKGKRHSACTTSRKKARGMISAIEIGKNESLQNSDELIESLVLRILTSILDGKLSER